MSKLHELLAVSSNKKGQVEKILEDITTLFTKKPHLFQEKVTTFTPRIEDGVMLVEEQSDLQTTVAKELDWLGRHLATGIDLAYQISQANTSAKADIVLADGFVLLGGIPATALLELEKSIAAIQKVVAHIPTLDPAKGFELDTAKGSMVYKARTVEKARTKKVKKVLVKFPATKEHPAQTEVYDGEEVTGDIRVQEWSSLLTPAMKAKLLDRCEGLMRAVKQARSRANETEVDVKGTKVGSVVTSYLLKVD